MLDGRSSTAVAEPGRAAVLGGADRPTEGDDRTAERSSWPARLAWGAVAATYLLIVAGAVVRASGSGLGCPDWPLCYGQPGPPGHPPAVIEFTHRLLGAITSTIILTALVAWVRSRGADRTSVGWAAAGLLLLATQIGLGAATVLLELPPFVVLGHLSLALVLLGGLVWLAVQLSRRRGREVAAASGRFRKLAIGAATAVFALALSGAYVRATGATWACAGFPTCNGDLLPFGSGRLVDIHLMHRVLALVVTGQLVATLARARRAEWEVPGVSAAASVVGLSLGGQLAVGAVAVSNGVPPLAQVLHVAGAAALWASTVALAAVAARGGGTGGLGDGGTATWRRGLRAGWPDSVDSRLPILRGTQVVIFAYLALTKPRIIGLLLLTTLGSMVLAAGGLPPVHLVALTLVGGALGAAAANTINCCLDRDIDAVMQRTASRPIPAGVIQPEVALRFGLILAVASFIVLALGVNLLAAALTLGALGFYVLVYTWWLKRSSVQNIVIGGAAGAVPPLVGWAAVTGDIGLLALYLFAIIFFWTPPHFWALSLVMESEYRAARIPMLPVVRGADETRWQVLVYSGLLATISVVVFSVGLLGALYLAGALALGGLFIYYAVRLAREGTPGAARRVFRYSVYYLPLLFVVMVVDRVTAFG